MELEAFRKLILYMQKMIVMNKESFLVKIT